MEIDKAIETMCRRCINHEQCQGTGCEPKNELIQLEKDLIKYQKAYQMVLDMAAWDCCACIKNAVKTENCIHNDDDVDCIECLNEFIMKKVGN